MAKKQLFDVLKEGIIQITLEKTTWVMENKLPPQLLS